MQILKKPCWTVMILFKKEQGKLLILIFPLVQEEVIKTWFWLFPPKFDFSSCCKHFLCDSRHWGWNCSKAALRCFQDARVYDGKRNKCDMWKNCSNCRPSLPVWFDTAGKTWATHSQTFRRKKYCRLWRVTGLQKAGKTITLKRERNTLHLCGI